MPLPPTNNWRENVISKHAVNAQLSKNEKFLASARTAVIEWNELDIPEWAAWEGDEIAAYVDVDLVRKGVLAKLPTREGPTKQLKVYGEDTRYRNSNYALLALDGNEDSLARACRLMARFNHAVKEYINVKRDKVSQITADPSFDQTAQQRTPKAKFMDKYQYLCGVAFNVAQTVDIFVKGSDAFDPRDGRDLKTKPTEVILAERLNRLAMLDRLTVNHPGSIIDDSDHYQQYRSSPFNYYPEI